MRTLKNTLNILLLLTGLFAFPLFMYIFEITPLTILAGILISTFILCVSLIRNLNSLNK